MEYVEPLLAQLHLLIKVQVIWILGHVDTPGNERAHELAKRGAASAQTAPPDGLDW